MTLILILKKIFWMTLLVYIGFGLLIFASHRSMIYHPNLISSDFNNCPAFDDSKKINTNGKRAYYKHIGDKIILVYNGNAGSACDKSHLKNAFEEHGYSYLFIEYSGYGGNKQKPSRKLLFKDTENITDFLKTKEYTTTIIFSESIGSGVASYQTTLMQIDGLIFIAPFDSLINVAKSTFPLYPMFLLEKFSNENYDNVAMLHDYDGRLKIIHGQQDAIIQIERGQALFESLQTMKKEFIKIEGAGHNDIYFFEETWHSISNFLSKDQYK